MLKSMEPCMSFFGRRVSNRAFTIVELLTVMAVIAILSAILLPVLGGFISSGEQAESLNRMRQIGQWMQLYAQDLNDVVLPSRFDTADNVLLQGNFASQQPVYAVDVEPSAGRGTWADILWVRNCQAEADYVTSRHDPVDPSDPQLFRVRAPDSMVWNDPSEAQNEGFGTLPDWDENPLRSKSKDVKTSPNSVGRAAPVPYGPGAGIQDVGAPGYFAANDWFRWLPDPDLDGEPWAIAGAIAAESHQEWQRYWTFSQLGNTSKSMYLVDSWRGEVIADSSWL